MVGKVIARWTGHTNIIGALCWNGDGERVLSGSHDGTARIWDVETGQTILDIKTGSDPKASSWVYTAIYSPDSTLIATSGYPSWEVKIWDAATGKLVSTLEGHTDLVNCLAWTANGRTLISSSDDNSIRTWSTTTWHQIAVLTAHTDSVYGIAISPNSCVLASASWDHTARLWNLEDGQAISLPLQHPNVVRSVSFSTDGTLLATGCFDNNAYTWDIGTIIQEAGLHKLLSESSPNVDSISLDSYQLNRPIQDYEKSFLDDDATPCPLEQPGNTSELPAGFFDDPPNHPAPIVTRPISPPSITQDPSPISESLHESIFQNPPLEVQLDSPEQTRPRFFKWPRKRKDEATELQGRPPAVVDHVPLAQGKLLNVSKWDIQRKEKRKEEARKAKNAQRSKKPAKSSPSPTQSNIAQQSAGASQVLPSSLSQADIATPAVTDTQAHAIPAPAATLTTRPSDVVTPRVGCGTRFSLCIGCVSRYDLNSHP